MIRKTQKNYFLQMCFTGYVQPIIMTAPQPQQQQQQQCKKHVYFNLLKKVNNVSKN